MSSQYQSPLTSRYASREMSHNFSDDRKFSCWRSLWLWLATAQKALGLPVTEAMLAEMAVHLQLHAADYQLAAVEEKKRRHDVMAHVTLISLQVKLS